MAIAVIMPRQGQSVETCIITKWFRKKGETVKTGDILFSYETDKAAFDMESPADGTLLEILHDEGAEVPVLSTVAFIGEPGETPGSSGEQSPAETAGTETAGVVTTGIETAGAETVRVETPETYEKSAAGALEPAIAESFTGRRVRISPRAKRLAERNNLDYSLISGSGPNGRIMCSDIQNALSAKAPVSVTAPAETPPLSPPVASPAEIPVSPEEYSDQPLSNVRKLIAKAMYSSLRDSAQLTHHMSADARNILLARRKIKEGLKSGTEVHDITINDIICWCVIKAIALHPAINAHFMGDSIRLFNRVHLGNAVDTPRGLMVPAIRNADQMDLPRLSEALKAAAEACRKGNINPELIQSTSASFTVSNLGNYGVEMFTPVINLPQCAILGVCTIINRPADLGNNTFGFVPYIGLSLTYDHRAIDGGPATLFLREIKEQIEQFNY